MHLSDPACARHGTGLRQIDISAAVICVFERLGWATAVHWPDPARLAARRRPGQSRPLPDLPASGTVSALAREQRVLDEMQAMLQVGEAAWQG